MATHKTPNIRPATAAGREDKVILPGTRMGGPYRTGTTRQLHDEDLAATMKARKEDKVIVEATHAGATRTATRQELHGEKMRDAFAGWGKAIEARRARPTRSRRGRLAALAAGLGLKGQKGPSRGRSANRGR